MATSVPMGIVSLKAEGAYAADKLYKKGMWVTSSGSSYAYINPTPSTGVPLTNTSHWQQIAEKGDPGHLAIQNISRVSGDGAPGSTDTYNVTYNNGTGEYAFTVYNGADNPNFTHIEEGLQHRDVASGMMFTMFQAVIRDLETRLAFAEAALAEME